MSPFSVHIGETSTSFEAPIKPNEPTPVARDVYWEGEAEDEEAATEAGYRAWDEKYGSGRQPVGAVLRITPINGRRRRRLTSDELGA
jgi:hypothetical protein